VRTLSAAEEDDAALAKPACDALYPAWITGRQKMCLPPTPQYAFGWEHAAATKMFAQTPLHPIVPAIRHAPRLRIPRGDECGARRSDMKEQYIRRPPPDADLDARSTVPSQPIRAQQTRRD